MIHIPRDYCTVRIFPKDDPDNGASVGYVETFFPLHVISTTQNEKAGCATEYMSGGQPTKRDVREAADLGYVVNDAIWRCLVDRQLMNVCYGERILNGRSPSLEHAARLRHVGLDQLMWEDAIIAAALRARNMLPICPTMPDDARKIVEVVVSHFFDVVKRLQRSIYKVT